MKRFISVLLCAVMAISGLFVWVSAAENQCDCGKAPVILLQGYSGPSLYLDLGLETEKKVWGLSSDNIVDAVKENIVDVLIGAGGVLVGDYEKLTDTIGKAAVQLLSAMEMNGDGTSKYNVSVYPTGAKNTQYSTLIERGEDNFIGERPLSDTFAANVGGDHVFSFTCDWRNGTVKNAASLDKYIQEVKALTGHSKVSLYGVSHGGQLGATYLYYYGEKGDIDKAVLNVPAIRGTSLVTDLLTDDNFAFNVAALIEFMEIGFRTEDEYEWLVDQFEFKALNKAVINMLREYLVPLLIKFGSAWDLIPPEDYDALKKIYLDPVEDAGLIAASDEMHYNVMPNISQGLKKAQAAGAQVSIMSNTGRALAGGDKKNSDYIITAACSSGAYCAPFGETFEKDYVQKGTTCSDDNHYHISPSMNIDASCSYLPENTWYINGQYHGQSHWDDYSRSLFCKLLFTDDIKDVYSDPGYPQFEIAQNPADGLYAKFDQTVSGYVTSKDTKLVVKNLSTLYDISLTAIAAKGAQLTFDFEKTHVIKAGKSIEIPFHGNLPDGDIGLISLDIDYIFYNRLPIAKSRVIDFTYMSDSFAQRAGKMKLEKILKIDGATAKNAPIELSQRAKIEEMPASAPNSRIQAIAVDSGETVQVEDSQKNNYVNEGVRVSTFIIKLLVHSYCKVVEGLHLA